MFNDTCKEIIKEKGYEDRKTAIIYGIEAHVCVL